MMGRETVRPSAPALATRAIEDPWQASVAQAALMALMLQAAKPASAVPERRVINAPSLQVAPSTVVDYEDVRSLHLRSTLLSLLTIETSGLSVPKPSCEGAGYSA